MVVGDELLDFNNEYEHPDCNNEHQLGQDNPTQDAAESACVSLIMVGDL